MTEHPVPAAVLVIAFEGWNDAGSAATGAVDLLATEWDAAHVESVDGEEFFDLQVNRPLVSRDDNGNRVMVWPGTDVYSGAMPSGRPVVLMRSIEPSLRWREFVKILLKVCRSYGVTEIYSLGALLADVPHSRSLPTSATSATAGAREKHGLRQSDYEGPTGIVGVFDNAASEQGFETVSLWVSVPHYVSDMPCPKATKALIDSLTTLLDEPVDLPDLEEDSARWESAVSDLAEENPEIAEYVAQLERNRDAAESPSATGEAIAAEFERYLRRHDG